MKELLNILSIDISLTIVIVNCGMASKVLKEAKKKGVSGGTILIGKGIAGSKLSRILGIDEARKEIIMMIMKKEMEDEIHEFIIDKFCLKKKNKGILFSIDLEKARGVKFNNTFNEENKKFETEVGDINMNNRNSKNNTHEAIFVVVNRGDAKKVVNTALKNGASGGTILHGRGAGMYENSSLFSMTIEPEKEIIMFLVEKEKVEGIVRIIEKTMEIEEPGKGIIFTVPVNKAKGLYGGE